MINEKRFEHFVNQCLDKFGTENQLDILEEECAELIQTCSKTKRSYPDSKKRLTEELAHVIISSAVVARIYDIGESDILREINKKANKYGFDQVE